MVGNIMSIVIQADTRKYVLHGIYVRATGIKVSMSLPPQHKFKLLILSSVANYVSHALL